MAVLKSLYFFDQPHEQSKRRQRKPVDQLPFSLPFTGVSGTLKVEAYLKQQLKLSQQQANNKEKVAKEDANNSEQEANENIKGPNASKVLLERADTGKKTRNKENKSVTINTEARVEDEEEEEDTQRFLFEENKFAAPNLLARLTRILDYLDEKQYGGDGDDDNNGDHGDDVKWTQMTLGNQTTSLIDSDDVRALNISLPFHLQEKLKWGFEQLISNTVYCKREWQTTSYKQQAETLAAQKTSREQTPINTSDLCNTSKNNKSEEMSDRKSGKPEESNTRKSSKTDEGSGRKMSRAQPISDANLTTTALKIEFQSPVDSEQSIIDESVLEAYPNVVSVPRESRGNVWYNNLPRTRLEKYKVLPDKFVPGSSLERRRRTGLQVKPDDQETQQGSDVSMVQLPVSSIAFSLMSKHCEDQGWVTHSGRDLERITLIEWAVTKLKEARTSSAHNGMAVIKKYYGLSSASKKQEDSIVFKQYGEVTSNKSKKAGKAKIRRTQSGTAKLELFMASLPDGTMTIYYPSGKIAVCMANNLVGDGKYTFVYDNTNSTSFMAYLTPTNLCCWDREKKHVLCDPNGGVIYSADGDILRKWVWTGSKLLPSIFLQLNEYISLKIISHNMMTLDFNCQHESYKLSLSISRDRKCVQHNAMGEIRTITIQESEISQPAPVLKPKVKSKKEERRAAKRRGCITEVEESVQETRKQELNQMFPERINLALDLPEDVDLYKLKRRIRNIAHEWMERYRVMLGITSPIKVLRKHARRKQTSSAKSLPSTLPSTQSSFRKLEEIVTSFETRVPSAPPVPRGDRVDFGKVTPLGKLTSLVENLKEHGVQKMNKENTSVSPIYLTEVEKTKTTSGPASPKPPFRCGLANHEPRCTSPKEGCPIALRSELLGEKYAYCRCKKREIPVVGDLEYDTFIRNHAAQSQLIVVSIVSSRFPDETPGITMLERFYYEKNRNRTFPCAQGGHDPFRIVLYDIHSSTENDEPLLMKRHNVVPGMFLMYIGGKLLFADHIFNGYGNEKNDFLKQITKSRKDFLQGLFLPQNFRLSPTPCRSGMRSAWGGEIGGISRMAVRNETRTSPTFSFAATRLPSAITSLSSESFDYRAMGAKSAASFVKLGLSIDSPFGKRVKSNHVAIPSVQKRTKN